MRIDAFSIAQGQVDVIGYIACFLLSLPLLWLAMWRGQVNLAALFILVSFVFYAALVAAVTASIPLFSLMLSRGGMLFWLLLGMAAALSIGTIRRRLDGGGSRIFRTAVRLSIALVALAAFRFTLGYFENPVPTDSYQTVANGCTILLIYLLLFADAQWERRRPVLLQMLLLAACTLVVLAVALTGSTSIVAFWLAALPLFLVSNFRKLSLAKRILFFAALAAMVAALFASEFFLRALLATRFSGLVTGEIQIGSVASRIHILSTFWDQFAVSPIFGSFQADEKVGLNPGNYVHSIPLSLMTHTGVVGLSLVVVAVSLVLLPRFGRRDRHSIAHLLATRLFVVIMLLGSLYTFFSWSPFWFMLGIMAIRPHGSGPEVER